MLSVLYVFIGPCNVIDSTVEHAYLVDRPTVGYRGVKVLIYKQSMKTGWYLCVDACEPPLYLYCFYILPM